MIGWRARLGFLIPPGSPTTEPEIYRMAPEGVSVHFTRMTARGKVGSLDNQEDRNRSMIAHLDENAEMMAMVKPSVMALTHTATSYTLGKAGEAELIQRMQDTHGVPFITAFGSVVAALRHLGIERVAVGTPYGEGTTLQCRENLQAHGFDVVSLGRLDGVTNIYDEIPERAYKLARQVDKAEAQAIFISGVGMRTIDVLEKAEADLGKPVFSSAVAVVWNSLRSSRVKAPVHGFGQLLQNVSDAKD